MLQDPQALQLPQPGRGACRGGTRQDVGSDLGGHVPCPASVSSSTSHVVARALHRELSWVVGYDLKEIASMSFRDLS